MLIVLTTTSDKAAAESLAQKIIEAKLAACVQISSPITSFYVWENALQKDSEYQLFIKTLPEKFDELRDFIQSNHSYETPEVVAISAEKVSEDYLNWVKESIKP